MKNKNKTAASLNLQVGLIIDRFTPQAMTSKMKFIREGHLSRQPKSWPLATVSLKRHNDTRARGIHNPLTFTPFMTSLILSLPLTLSSLARETTSIYI